MDIEDPRKRETEALIAAIWGPALPEEPRLPCDPTLRAAQNEALATAMKAYLLQYLRESEPDGAHP